MDTLRNTKVERALMLMSVFTSLWTGTTPADEMPIVELEPVTVTAQVRDPASQPGGPSKVLKDDELRMKMGHSVGETLKQELGITSQSFGPGVGTPVIRGQAGPRVRVLANGIGTGDVAAISPDHATSVEPLLAERIEVLRGPSTLLYGSGNTGGVINVIDNRIPGEKPDRLLGTALEQRYDSASDETSTALKAEGGRDAFAYHFDGFYRERNNLDIGGYGIDEQAVRYTDPSLDVTTNPKGKLPNTWGHTVSGSAGASWVGDAGFAGVSINRLQNNYGIAPDGTGTETTHIDLRQNKYDFKSELNVADGFARSLRTRLGYTDYQHTEITNGNPGAYFTNQTYEGRLDLVQRDMGPLKGVMGFQAIASDFNAMEKSSGASIVPRSLINSYAVFAVETLDIGPVTYQFGTRIDPTTVAPQGYKELAYLPVSASASALWRIDERHRLNLAVTRASRAPQVQELLVHGYHDATRSYEQGNIGLKEETSYNLDLGYQFRSERFRADFDLFHNWASDYIYQQRTGQFVDEEGQPCVTGCVPVLANVQGDAIFKGYEAKLTYTAMENRFGVLDLSLFSDYTRGQFVQGGDVPRMPPLRYGFEVNHQMDDWNSYLRLTRAEEQTHAGAHETTTPGYLLLNVGTQYQIKTFDDAKLMVFAKANNLLDENIRNATSYLRNFAPEPGRGGEIGVRLTF